jgi:NitT/TauT family transport system permease protein
MDTATVSLSKAKAVRSQDGLMIGEALPGVQVLLLGVAGWAIFFLLWELSLVVGLSNQALLPHVTRVATAFATLFTERGFHFDVLASLWRIALSFTLVCAIGVPVGVLMGAFLRIDALLGPFVSTWRYLPAASFVPLLLMWFGADEGQKIALLVLGAVWFLITLVADHTKSVRKELVETSLTLGASKWQVLWTVIIPAALPNIFVAMRQMLAIGWTYLVIAEIVATTDGIGAAMMRSKRFLRVDEIIAAIVMIGVLGLLSDIAFRRFARALFPYKDKREL